MKWKVIFSGDEEPEAVNDALLLLRRHPDGKMRRARTESGGTAIYIRVDAERTKPLTPCDVCRNRSPPGERSAACEMCSASSSAQG